MKKIFFVGALCALGLITWSFNTSKSKVNSSAVCTTAEMIKQAERGCGGGSLVCCASNKLKFQ